MKDYRFQFSIIIPVYNVEQYLAETLDSVINQTIGFEDNIQIILVNDGSPDNSERICMKYKDKYHDNIVYVKKENGGVSSARNEGIQYAEGKYVNFLDSDDCWEKDSFEHVLNFFDEYYDQVDVVGCRKKFFDAQTGYHNLDYKFTVSKIVDLRDEYEFIQMDVTGAFIKNEAIGDIRFSTRLKYGEDAEFVNRILLEKCTLGVCREAEQLYRKRQDDTSALQNELRSESYYFDTPIYLHKAMFERSVEKYGKIEPGSFVAIRTDWYKRWPDAEKFFQADADGQEHFPGWGIEAMKFLVEERGVIATGHETLDPDAAVLITENGDFVCERYILGTGNYQIEGLQNLDQVPPTGAQIFIACPRIVGASGFTVRVWAIV